MLEFDKEKRVANKIKEMLNKRGFTVEIRASKHTKSVYLILDNGACSSIRVSDHKSYNKKSQFNVIKEYVGKRCEYYKGRKKLFYDFHMIGILIADIESERSNKMLAYGYTKYKAIRDKEHFSKYYIPNRKVA